MTDVGKVVTVLRAVTTSVISVMVIAVGLLSELGVFGAPNPTVETWVSLVLGYYITKTVIAESADRRAARDAANGNGGSA